MKVRVLGCSGAIARDCFTTSFLLDDDVLIDAGTGVGNLALEEMAAVEHVLLTHSHLDHIAALPLMIDAVFSRRQTPLKIHALQATIDALKTHIFNNTIWPDFSKLPTPQAPLVRFHSLQTGQTLEIGKKQVEVLPATHTVPAVGYAVLTPKGHWVYTGDTACNPALWQRLQQIPMATLIIETAFSNKDSALAEKSLHLSPRTLEKELGYIQPNQRFPIYITHIKPGETEQIINEIDAFNEDLAWPLSGRLHDIQQLQTHQVFEF